MSGPGPVATEWRHRDMSVRHPIADMRADIAGQGLPLLP
jgi:hypothetical protein